MMTTKITALLRAAIAGLALAFLILPAAPLGGIVPIPTAGGKAFAVNYGGDVCTEEHIRAQRPCDINPPPEPEPEVVPNFTCREWSFFGAAVVSIFGGGSYLAGRIVLVGLGYQGVFGCDD